ncbi:MULTISPECIES: ead/Ea22-like family protein [Klebsiella]|uniref:ead/Ea22-like family protein n=1 Tax=Klebsiella TaxID=570 RepID=UPI0004A83908|nr:ead/Ea22-like family protein [Klebsiella michiganensis]AID89278.1 hypothetical protein KONIH1_09460 [Klebsiella oxytoca KONIH1]CAF2404562.1 hypothetical protein AI2828V5_3900 [Klebsiella oxytoca]CAH5830748.1 hypothetical protein AI2828V5_3900 [Klebsiella oxytoca]
MTTDITELVQSLKAAAENAIGAHERLAAYPYGEIIDISQHEGEQIDIDITDLNEFNKEANPVNILALVEALEQAQTDCNEYASSERAVAVKSVELQDEIYGLKARIAELESRTVKLPPKVDSSNIPFAGHTWNCCLDEVEKRLAAAGIKVEAE